MSKTQTIEAVYENGILHPKQKLEDLPEHSEVKITIEWSSPEEEHPLLKFAGILSNSEAEALKNTIIEEFNQVNQNEW
jgi:predicted DNA-binding antitoxin AbrB/MazE fold protein